jgi:FkbM family methyltransferase
MNNVSLVDVISAYAKFLKFRAALLLRTRKLYRNYLHIINSARKDLYPIDAVLRNDKHILLKNWNEVFIPMLIYDHKGIEYDISNDEVTIASIHGIADDKKKIKLHGGITNGDIASIFLSDVYRTLSVEGQVVIDIGANIGDSSIYFILRGAERVIALEPFPKNYELAKKNIEENNCSNRISILLAGCATSRGFIELDDAGIIGSSATIGQCPDGTRVALLTLDDILYENNLLSHEVILKMDCEGCEYETILSASHDTLRKFSQILLEYHYGYRNLKKKLEISGFHVSTDRPIGNYHKMYSGYLYAKQNF